MKPAPHIPVLYQWLSKFLALLLAKVCKILGTMGYILGLFIMDNYYYVQHKYNATKKVNVCDQITFE